MLIRRCALLFFEAREGLDLDLRALFSGAGVLAARVQMLAMAPHLGGEIALDSAQLAAVQALGPTLWLDYAPLAEQFGAACLEGLLELGLLVSDAPAHAHWRARDEALRAMHWHPVSALQHIYTRWHNVEGENGNRFPSFEDLVEAFGAPPPAAPELGQGIALPAPPAGPLDANLLSRYTGRNFDPEASVPLDLAARLLQRSFGAQQVRHMTAQASALKKTSPSGGSLHPVEAYLMAQRVDGLAPGIYHYHSVQHSLHWVGPLERDLVNAAVASQPWFLDAPMMVVLAARAYRSFWKYRENAKAYRVLMLDAGHLSQTFYLLANEAGLPAFITAGINEVNIEQALGLDPLQDVVIALCGCGPAAETVKAVEFR